MPRPEIMVLDLGNVVFRLDWMATMRALHLEGNKAGKFFLDHIQTWPPYDAFERGKISLDEFLNQVAEVTGKKYPEKEFITAWERLVVDYFDEVMPLLQKVARRMPLYALTNTNPIHLHMLRTKFPEMQVFRSLFNSVDWGVRKPEVEIYKRCEKATGYSGDKIFYADDSLDNVQAALKLNWRAVHCPIGGLVELLYNTKVI